MTRTTRIPAAEITGFKGALIKRFAKKTLGRVPSSLGVYWHDQQALMGMAAVGGKVQKWDACDEQLKSFAHIAVAAERLGWTIEDDSAILHDVAIMCNTEGDLSILFDQEEGRTALGIDLLNDAENLAHEQGSKAQRRLIK